VKKIKLSIAMTLLLGIAFPQFANPGNYCDNCTITQIYFLAYNGNVLFKASDNDLPDEYCGVGGIVGLIAIDPAAGPDTKKMALSVLQSAYLSGKLVNVEVDGCVISGGASHPKLRRIKLH